MRIILNVKSMIVSIISESQKTVSQSGMNAAAIPAQPIMKDVKALTGHVINPAEARLMLSHAAWLIATNYNRRPHSRIKNDPVQNLGIFKPKMVKMAPEDEKAARLSR